jgi:hypothetical protein
MPQTNPFPPRPAGDVIFSQTPALTLPQTGVKTIFSFQNGGTYFGPFMPVRIIQIFGIVTTLVGAVANATKLQALMDALTAVDLCATLDINAAAVGSIMSITGTLANAMALNANGVIIGQAGSILLSGGQSTGIIRVNCAGSDGGTGKVAWYIMAQAAPGVRIVPAMS